MDELSSDSQRKRASSVLQISFGLSEASFVCQPKSQELTTRVMFVEAASSR